MTASTWPDATGAYLYDIPDVLRVLHEIVDPDPGYHYEKIKDPGLAEVYSEKSPPGCWYIGPGRVPSCGVGRYAIMIGKQVDDLLKIEGFSPDDEEADPVFADHSPEARDLLGVFQSSQDSGLAFGEALALAEGGFLAGTRVKIEALVTIQDES